MEVLVISHKYPPSIGGMQTHCYELVRELEKFNTVHKIIYKNNYPKAFFMVTAAIRAYRLLRKNKSIEVIYFNDGLMALFCIPLLKWTSIPKAVTIHGLDIAFPAEVYQRLIRKYLNQFDRLITVSGPTTELALQKGLEPHRVVKVENAVDIDTTHPERNPNFRKELSKELGIDLENKFIITSLGRTIPRKGFSWFTREVAPQLPENCVYLIIARKPPFEQLFRILKSVLPERWFERIRVIASAETDDMAINRAIQELKLEKKVIRLTQFTKSRESILEVIRNSDLFVMPNIHIEGDYEGFGLVALEASSQGTLTLAANTDGIPSAVTDGVTGYLIESGNPKAWIEKIDYLQQHPEVCMEKGNEFGQNSLSKKRSWQTMAEKYAEVFAEMVKIKTGSTAS